MQNIQANKDISLYGIGWTTKEFVELPKFLPYSLFFQTTYFHKNYGASYISDRFIATWYHKSLQANVFITSVDVR